MSYFSLLLPRSFRCAYIHASVHLHRVDRQQLDGLDVMRNFHRERGLSTCGWPNYDNGLRRQSLYGSQEDATGIRVLCFAGAVTSNNSPMRLKVRAPVTRTRA